MFKNSLKLRLLDGVPRAKPANGAPPPPGVDIMDEGKGGGVEGACIRVLTEPARTGVGDVGRRRSGPASSSDIFPSRAAPAAVKPL